MNQNPQTLTDKPIASFSETLKKNKLTLKRTPTEILQVNIGKRCNQACLHCHVEAGPKRTENMEKKTVDRLLTLLDECKSIHTVDLTGGAPELNPHFRYFVENIRKLNRNVIDRCNLTVLFEPGQESTAEFLAEQKVEIVASLPCYSKNNVDQQRGNGVFEKSIKALQNLNELGYAKEDTGLNLSLVYNPTGAFLPPSQITLEAQYKKELKELFNIEFNQLYTITNMPIKRFLRDLKRTGKLQEYMELLVQSFNPHAANQVMCKNIVSVGWDGNLYDCDFNQMLEIPLSWKTETVWTLHSIDQIQEKEIAFADHCYGCTAGAGSSCGGSLI